MVGSGVAVDAKLAAQVAASVTGTAKVSVSAVCRELGCSRETFYKYRNRFLKEGVAGLTRRSTRPATVASVLDVEQQELLIRIRKELADNGLDCGARSIIDYLTDHGELWPGLQDQLPSDRTVHRLLVARGQIVPAPQKRPRSSGRRFQAAHVNGMWQMDGFELLLPGGQKVTILHLIDDHSRLDLGCHVARSENAADVWTAFTIAARRYGLPAKLLTDNGTAFSGARRGWTSALEVNVRALGVTPLTARPHHPQTCGKVERAHKTARLWLSKHPLPDDLTELQTLLDEQYRPTYNHRRHQSLHHRTPQHLFDTGPRAEPAANPISPPLHVTTHQVSPRGQIYLDSVHIGIGRQHQGQQATAFRTADEVTIFVGNTLVTHLTIDRTRTYQRQLRSPHQKTEVSAKS